MTQHEPQSVEALADLVASTSSPLRIVGGGSGQDLAGPVSTAEAEDVVLRNLDKITLFEPTELVVSAQAGVTLDDLTAMLEDKNLLLPFDPPDYREVLGTSDHASTVGGLVAGGHSGPGRLIRGALRDSLIGVKLVNGIGEQITAGGRVMKNVTGYDVTKLVAGSWGTLGVITEATFKLSPCFEAETTLVLWDADVPMAVAAMSAALGTPYEVQEAACLPAELAQRSPFGVARNATLLRLQNFAEFLPARSAALQDALAGFGAFELVDYPEPLWRSIRDLTMFAADREALIWRINCRPSHAAELVARLEAEYPGCATLLDWAGGRLWVETAPDSDASAMRLLVASIGGHAMLFRGPEDLRRSLPALPPETGPMAQIALQVKQAFDPNHKLNPGRMPIEAPAPV